SQICLLVSWLVLKLNRAHFDIPHGTSLCVLKIRLLRKISHLRNPSSGQLCHVNWTHDPVSSGVSFLVRCLLSLGMNWDWSGLPGDSRSASSSARTPLEPWGSSVLARPPPLVVKMGERAGGGEAGDRRRQASRRVPVVLALAFAPPSRPTQDHYG